MKLKNDRWKNYALWVAIASLIFMILVDAGVGIVPEKYEAYVQVILTIAVLAGIINDPNEGKGLSDDHEH